MARGYNTYSAIRRLHFRQDDIEHRDARRFLVRARRQVCRRKNDQETLDSLSSSPIIMSYRPVEHPKSIRRRVDHDFSRDRQNGNDSVSRNASL